MRNGLVGLLFFTAEAHGQEPWLADAEQQTLRSLMPAGVPFGDEAKFFRLPQVYQELVVLNGASSRTIRAVTTQEHPWIVSGGMHWADKSEWRNVTALEIPKRKFINWWVEDVDAGATYLVPRIRWLFPVGTIAYDILLRRRPDSERVFEVRIHEKRRDGWSSGESYRPEVAAENIHERQHDSWFRFGLPDDGSETLATRLEWRTVGAINPLAKFVSTKTVTVDNGGFTPRNYFGTGLRCNACHSRVGMRTGYGTIVRGDDGRFSWHPFTQAGEIDHRWPMVRR